MKNIIVLISGNGSNLQAIIDSCKNNIINAKIKLVISNKENAYGLVRANNNNILNKVVKYNRKKESREEYELRLINEIKNYTNDIDLVILAGWMLLLTPIFINKFNNKIINLHPALPGEFPGINAIERAFISYKNNKINHTGVMVHYVIEEVDAGKVIDTIKVIIEPNDTLESLTEKIHNNEKKVLISAIQQILN